MEERVRLIRDDDELENQAELPEPDEDKPVAQLASPDEDEDSEDEGSSGEISSSGGPAWLRPLGAILAAIIILFLLAIFARWIYGEVTGNNSPKKGATHQGQTPAAPGPSSGKSGAGNKSSGSSSATGTANKGGQLPNNGPGDVAAIFVAASLAAAGLHFIVQLRRTKFNIDH